MPVPCERNIPESRRGVGACDIRFDMLKRSGKPNWWCYSHGMEASLPDGSALAACPAAWLEPVPPALRLEIDLTDGEYAVWGVVRAAIEIGSPPAEAGSVHVHRRAGLGKSKDIDQSFDIVTAINGPNRLVIDGMAARAFSLSELAGQSLKPLACPRCGDMHIDERRFATRPHRRHLCNSCGHPFNDASGPSISNPLANAHAVLGLSTPPPPTPVTRPLMIESADYGAVALWPSNSAIVSTMARPEECGIHVHAWTSDGKLVVDETHSPVVLDGHPVNERDLRWLAVQRALAHDTPIMSIPCSACGSRLLSPIDGWIEPRTVHGCQVCGESTKTRRRVFLNPLAEK